MWDTLVWQACLETLTPGRPRGSGDGVPGLSGVQGAGGCCCALEGQVPLGCHPGRLAVKGEPRAQLVAGAFSSWPSLLLGNTALSLQVAFGSCPSPLGLLIIGVRPL